MTRTMSSDSENEANGLAISEDLITSPQHKAAGTSSLDFNGLLHTSLKLHEDLSQGCGGQLWPAGMVLGKYLLREKHLNSIRGKSMFVCLL